MNVAAFFSYIFLTAFTPGPNNILSMTNASKYGLKKSLPFNIGVFLGFLLIMSACAAFSTLLYGFIPSIKPAMLVIGAAYLLYLAWTVFRDRPHGEGGGLSRTNTLLSGLVLQLVNVKVILYGITALSSFVLPYFRGLAALAGFVLLLAGVGFLGTLAWALFGTAFERFLKRYGKVMNAAMALLLVYCAVVMLLDLRA